MSVHQRRTICKLQISWAEAGSPRGSEVSVVIPCPPSACALTQSLTPWLLEVQSTHRWKHLFVDAPLFFKSDATHIAPNHNYAQPAAAPTTSFELQHIDLLYLYPDVAARHAKDQSSRSCHICRLRILCPTCVPMMIHAAKQAQLASRAHPEEVWKWFHASHGWQSRACVSDGAIEMMTGLNTHALSFMSGNCNCSDVVEGVKPNIPTLWCSVQGSILKVSDQNAGLMRFQHPPHCILENMLASWLHYIHPFKACVSSRLHDLQEIVTFHPMFYTFVVGHALGLDLCERLIFFCH